jgi:hypothetical protein
VTEEAYRVSNNPFNNPPHVGLATVIPTYVCPSDGRPFTTQVSQQSGHIVALTSYLGVLGKDVLTLDGVLFADSRTRIADITDGTSNTLLVGERPPSADYQFGW